MANRNGLLAPQATHGNPQESYYLRKGEAIVEPLTIEAADGSTAAVLYVDPAAAGAYQGALNLTPGANGVSATAAAGITIRTGAGASTIAEVGTNSVANNLLYIAGTSGVSQVYDEKYNPVIIPTQIAGLTGSIPANTGVGLFTFTPAITGAYMLQVNFNIANTDTIPVDGILEWVLNVGGGEVQYTSSTLKSTSISKASDFDEVNGIPGVLAPPMDYSFSNMAILTAGLPVSFALFCARNSAAGGLPWSIANYQVRVIQMC